MEERQQSIRRIGVLVIVVGLLGLVISRAVAERTLVGDGLPALGASDGTVERSRKLTTGHFKDEPVEVTSITLDGKVIQPNDSFIADENWPARLLITVKNVSDKPISFIDVVAFTPPAHSRGEAPFDVTYSFVGSLLQPDATTALTAGEAFGDVVSDKPVKVLLQHVIWNNDRSIMWSAGKLLRFDPATRSYKPGEEPVARYRLPREYQQQIKKVAFDPTPLCTERYLSEVAATYSSWDQCVPTIHCEVPDLQAAYNLLGNDVRPFAQHKRCMGCDGILQCAGYKTAYSTDICQPTGDPIMVDVLGNGFNLTDQKAGVGFDLFGFGRLVLTAWTAPESDDAFLVLDRNLNGVIDSGVELFGNMTAQPLTWGEPNGFKALAVFDNNGDGRISRQDEVFNQLQFWRDVNHNGVSEFSELIPLSSTTIEAFELNYKAARKRDAYGNLFRYRAKVIGKRMDRWAWDVYLKTAL